MSPTTPLQTLPPTTPEVTLPPEGSGESGEGSGDSGEGPGESGEGSGEESGESGDWESSGIGSGDEDELVRQLIFLRVK